MANANPTSPQRSAKAAAKAAPQKPAPEPTQDSDLQAQLDALRAENELLQQRLEREPDGRPLRSMNDAPTMAERTVITPDEDELDSGPSVEVSTKGKTFHPRVYRKDRRIRTGIGNEMENHTIIRHDR